MKLSKTYRHLTAAWFLLIYVFIATPVQLWHHHTAVKEKPAAAKISKTVVSSQKEDCKLCQHTYAVYTIDETRYDEFVAGLPAENNSFPVTSFPDPCLDKASNKGPPSVSYCC